MITRIYIDNFRCFSSFELKPDRVNLLIGNNGAGKSAFVEAVHGVVALVAMGAAVEDEFPAETRTRWDSRPLQRIELDVSGNGGVYHYVVEISHDPPGEAVRIEREMVEYLPTEVMGLGSVLFLYKDGKVELHNNQGKLGTEFAFRGGRSFLPQLQGSAREFAAYVVS